ncbi:MAG: DUF4296 domain-containing protein [Bacteroidales bacterium]
MKKWAFLICMALLFASCNSILSSKPVGTLSESQMVDLLVDMHLTEASLKMASDSTSKLNDTTGVRQRFAQVFKKHDVEPDRFNKSLNYYIEHIEDLNKIYSEVIVKLTELDAQQTAKSTPALNAKYPASNRHSKANRANPWYRTLDKNCEPVEFQYFDNDKYPVTTSKGPLK